MVRIAPNNVIAGLTAIQNTWLKFYKAALFEYNFLDESFTDRYQEDQQTSLLIFIFAIIAIVISSLGLFGLAAYCPGNAIPNFQWRYWLTNFGSLFNGR